jgi:hypothetical protein
MAWSLSKTIAKDSHIMGLRQLGRDYFQLVTGSPGQSRRNANPSPAALRRSRNEQARFIFARDGLPLPAGFVAACDRHRAERAAFASIADERLEVLGHVR